MHWPTVNQFLSSWKATMPKKVEMKLKKWKYEDE